MSDSLLTKHLARVAPLRRHHIEAEQLCINLCHRIVWREYFRDADEMTKLYRALERARARVRRRWQALLAEEARYGA